jgi:CBS domain-containing protein
MDESVWQAAERMHQRAVGMLVVMDDQQHPVGVLTDRDIVERVVAQRREAGVTKVADIMTPSPTTVREDVSIESALALMRAHAVRRLPVVDTEDRMLGIVSLDDILVLLAEEFADIGRLLERQTPQAAAGVA